MIGDRMNKKGFTLIELMVTVGLLALMGVIIGVNITSILKSTQKNEEDFDKETIEKAACVYYDSELNTEPSSNITIKKLINSGLLDESYETKEGTIKITITDEGQKKCEYKR